MKKQISGSHQELPQPDELELKINNSQEPISEYINFLRNQIKHLGNTIDSEFDKASEFIFSLYKHYYSPSQCPGQKATLLNKLSSCGVQWALQSNLEQRIEEFQGHSDEGRSANLIQSEAREVPNPNKAYNMRIKTKPQKYKYSNIEDEYSYGDKVTTPRHDGPKRGRPATKKESEIEFKRDTSNPYEKAPYKKRRVSHLDQDQKEESVGREDINKSSAKWDSEEDKEEGNDAKVEQEVKSPEKDHHFSSEKAIKHEEGKKSKTAKETQKAGKVEGSGQGETVSQLVEEYKKTWENCIFELSLQTDNV